MSFLTVVLYILQKSLEGIKLYIESLRGLYEWEMLISILWLMWSYIPWLYISYMSSQICEEITFGKWELKKGNKYWKKKIQSLTSLIKKEMLFYIFYQYNPTFHECTFPMCHVKFEEEEIPFLKWDKKNNKSIKNDTRFDRSVKKGNTYQYFVTNTIPHSMIVHFLCVKSNLQRNHICKTRIKEKAT